MFLLKLSSRCLFGIVSHFFSFAEMVLKSLLSKSNSGGTDQHAVRNSVDLSQLGGYKRQPARNILNSLKRYNISSYFVII